jgi:hypothetical protein
MTQSISLYYLMLYYRIKHSNKNHINTVARGGVLKSVGYHPKSGFGGWSHALKNDSKTAHSRSPCFSNILLSCVVSSTTLRSAL